MVVVQIKYMKKLSPVTRKIRLKISLLKVGEGIRKTCKTFEANRNDKRQSWSFEVTSAERSFWQGYLG